MWRSNIQAASCWLVRIAPVWVLNSQGAINSLPSKVSARDRITGCLFQICPIYIFLWMLSATLSLWQQGKKKQTKSSSDSISNNVLDVSERVGNVCVCVCWLRVVKALGLAFASCGRRSFSHCPWRQSATHWAAALLSRSVRAVYLCPVGHGGALW